MLTGDFLGFILVIVGAPLVFLLVLHTRKAKKLERAQKLAKLEQEAIAFFEQLYRTGFKPVETRLILQKEEFALLEETCVALQETRSFRVYGGGGTRVGKIYLGGGVSESEQRWKQIDVGTLTLTTKRIVFDGSRENRTIRLSDVLSVTAPSLDAIEVSSQRRAKAAAFTGLLNPLIWAPLIQRIAKGEGPPAETADGKPTPSAAPPQEANSGTAQLTAPLHQRAISLEEARKFFSKPAGPSGSGGSTTVSAP
jgi:hypothetical protein